ncbi:hypothetical protein V6N13_073444 [Hibiscus sabdariffa]|uniref:Uncharacterized protein n=1 Tax=Hibiscus sabdariffa TaxID=183260 RepID=A0ABR2BEW6_9ROSI
MIGLDNMKTSRFIKISQGYTFYSALWFTAFSAPFYSKTSFRGRSFPKGCCILFNLRCCGFSPYSIE